jgi:hypothetical protein
MVSVAMIWRISFLLWPLGPFVLEA